MYLGTIHTISIGSFSIWKKPSLFTSLGKKRAGLDKRVSQRCHHFRGKPANVATCIPTQVKISTLKYVLQKRCYGISTFFYLFLLLRQAPRFMFSLSSLKLTVYHKLTNLLTSFRKQFTDENLSHIHGLKLKLIAQSHF